MRNAARFAWILALSLPCPAQDHARVFSEGERPLGWTGAEQVETDILLADMGNRPSVALVARAGGAVQFLLPGPAAAINMDVPPDVRPIALALSPDSSHGAASFEGGELRWWHVATGKLLWKRLFEKPAGALCFSPDSRRLFIGLDTGSILSADQNGPAGEFARLDRAVARLRASPGGSELGGIDSRGELRLWDARTGDLKWTLSSFTDFAFYPLDPEIVFVIDLKGSIRVLDKASAGTMREFVPKESVFVRVAWQAPLGRIVGQTAKGAIYEARIFDDFCLEVMDLPAPAIALQPSGQTALLSAPGKPASIRWLRSSYDRLPDSSTVSFIRFSPDGNRVLTGLGFCGLRSWETTTGKLTDQWHWEGDTWVNGWFQAEEVLGARVKDRKVRVENLSRGTPLLNLRQADFSPQPVAWRVREDVSWIAFSEEHDSIRLSNLETGLARRAVPIKGGTPALLAFTPQEDGLVAIHRDRLQVLNFEGIVLLDKPLGVEVSALAFSPDGYRYALSSHEGVTISDFGPGRRRQLAPDQGPVAFSRTGAWLAIGKGREVRVLDSITGECVQEFPGRDSAVSALAFSPGDTEVFSGHLDGSVVAWKLEARVRRKAPTEDRERLWGDLMHRDADRAMMGAAGIEGLGTDAISFLMGKLLDEKAAATAGELLAAMLSADKSGSEVARAEVEYVGAPAMPALTRLLESDLDKVQRTELEQLRDNMERRVDPTPSTRRRIRAMGILERLAARDALQRLSLESPSPRERADAAAALERLARR